jgi:hypothetical protein
MQMRHRASHTLNTATMAQSLDDENILRLWRIEKPCSQDIITSVLWLFIIYQQQLHLYSGANILHIINNRTNRWRSVARCNNSRIGQSCYVRLNNVKLLMQTININQVRVSIGSINRLDIRLYTYTELLANTRRTECVQEEGMATIINTVSTTSWSH